MSKDNEDFRFLIRNKMSKDDSRLLDSNKQEVGKKKLLDDITKRMQTINIGDICAVEEALGFLWGHKSYKDRSKEEEYVYQRWQECRKAMLDKGNKQIRKVEEEFKAYTIVYNGYKLTLPVYRTGQ